MFGIKLQFPETYNEFSNLAGEGFEPPCKVNYEISDVVLRNKFYVPDYQMRMSLINLLLKHPKINTPHNIIGDQFIESQL